LQLWHHQAWVSMFLFHLCICTVHAYMSNSGASMWG